MAAALVGVAGNELLAQYKISVGKRINSVSLIADGYHSRIDGRHFLAAFVGLVGVLLGFPKADPIAGIVITIVIVTVVFSTSRSVLQRLLDAVDPHIVPSIVTLASEAPGVEQVTDVRARWGRAYTACCHEYRSGCRIDPIKSPCDCRRSAPSPFS